ARRRGRLRDLASGRSLCGPLGCTLAMDTTIILPLLLAVAGLGCVLGSVLSVFAWLYYRQSDVPLAAVFLNPLFIISDSYFRHESRRLRSWAASSFTVGTGALWIWLHAFAPLNRP